MKKYTFNTGRFYTKEGQRIEVTVLGSNTVYFNDIDRHIEGVITDMADVNNEDEVIRKYDYNEYEMCYKWNGKIICHNLNKKWEVK